MKIIKEIAELQGIKSSEQQLNAIYTKAANQYIENILNNKAPEDKPCNSPKTK
ncbi:hypothetical protein ACFLQL_02265 [Verrucomicrobiota bacterium]